VPLGSTTLALSIDLSLEGVHFRTDWLSFKDIGWRATAAALSDLAAEGAEPIGILVSLGTPADEGRRTTDNAAEIMAGVGAAAQSVGARVLGGDLVRSPRYLVDVCVLGIARRPVRRAGARPGQGLWVTGALGGAALGLAQLRDGRRPTAALFRRFAHPEPRISAGRPVAPPRGFDHFAPPPCPPLHDPHRVVLRRGRVLDHHSRDGADRGGDSADPIPPGRGLRLGHERLVPRPAGGGWDESAAGG